MIAIVFDTETTDTRSPEIIEASWMVARLAAPGSQTGRLQFDPPVTGRFKPSGRISMGAMATHHIMEEDLVDCPPSATFVLPPGVAYLIGHRPSSLRYSVGPCEVQEDMAKRVPRCARATAGIDPRSL